MQELLVGTYLCNGPIFQHHNPIGLGQDVERVSHENPRLGRKGVEVTTPMCLTAFQSWGWGQEVPGAHSGETAPSHALALVLEICTS